MRLNGAGAAICAAIVIAQAAPAHASTACLGVESGVIQSKFAAARQNCAERRRLGRTTESASAAPVELVPAEIANAESAPEPAIARPEAPVSITVGRVLTSEPRRKAPRVARRGYRPVASASPLIDAVGRIYRIDPALLHAVVRQESGGRLAAVSSKGALGLMQVMPGTARELGVRDPAQLTQDPVLALTTGAVYLKRMQAKFGNDVPRVLAAYNAGPGAVQRHKGVPPYRETQAYVRSIVSNYQALRAEQIGR